MLELYDIEELFEGTFPLYFNLIDLYQQEDPIPTEKLKCAEYSTGSFRGCRSTIKFVTHKYKIVIPRLIQKYVVKWYHAYLLYPGMDCTEAMILQHLY